MNCTDVAVAIDVDVWEYANLWLEIIISANNFRSGL